MFCTSCGQQIPDGSKFCTKCGHPVAAAEATASTAQETGAPQMTPPAPGAIPEAAEASKAPKAPRLNSKIVGIAVVAIAAIVAVILVLVLHKPTLDLDQYFTFEYDGYDTVGTLRCEFDTEQFNKDYAGKVTANSLKKAMDRYQTADSSLSDLVDFLGGYDALASSINEDMANSLLSDLNWSVDPTEGLSNGDTITLTWDNDETDLAIWQAILGSKIKADDMSVTVEGLEEIATFDAFEGVEITYKGTAPDGRVDEVTGGSDAACSNLYYNVEPRDGLSNGDTVTVTISYNGYTDGDWETRLATDYGKIPAELTKEFTVEGLQSYVAETDEIPEETMDLMKSQAEDTFYAEVANYYDSDTIKITNCEYIGNYFLHGKEGAFVQANNYIFLIYKVSAHIEYTNRDGDSYVGDPEYYWYCRFGSLLITEEGDCKVDLSNYKTPRSNSESFTIDSKVSSGWLSTKTWGFYGYDKLSYMYNQLITTNIDRFSSEDNVEDITLTGDGTDVQSEDADGSDSESAEDADDGQVLSYSSDRALTEDDLEGLSKDDIQTAINEIYARHGYTFQDETILEQFEEYDWYEPTVASDGFSEDVFTQIERDNIAFMREHL